MRVLSAVGPGDVISAFSDWKEGVRTVSETSITFSSQEFEFFRKHGIAFWAISSHPHRGSLVDALNRIENRPRAMTSPVSGLRFHAVQLLYAASLLVSAIRFRATHAIIDSGTTHWFALFLFRLFGILVVPNFHNVYWPVGHKPKGAIKRSILLLDELFFRYGASSALGVSPECGRQLDEISGGSISFFDYRAQYVASEFEALPRLALSSPMRILFAGRIEENKGVFDILSVCEALTLRRPGEFIFEICGDGPAFAQLADRIAMRGMGSSMILHGRLVRPDLLRLYGKSHLVIVPTRSTFCEGLPMVCAEAVMSGRPVLTSALSNALSVLEGAVIEARADDPEDYCSKIEALSRDPARYANLVRSTEAVGLQFMDSRFGLVAALEHCLLNDIPPPDGGSREEPVDSTLRPIERRWIASCRCSRHGGERRPRSWRRAPRRYEFLGNAYATGWPDIRPCPKPPTG